MNERSASGVAVDLRATVGKNPRSEIAGYHAVGIKKRAGELGLDVCGITSADPARHAAFYQQWTAEGKAGEMQWLTREPERRADPRIVLPGANSIIVAGLNYWQPQPKG